MSFLKSFLKKEKVRTRFAPSPTGFLHVGGLRTALYSYLFARQHGGKFILRLEDTDQKRYVEGAAEAIYSGLKWAGLEYDEGPDAGGQHGPYIQSERLDIYKKYSGELIKNKNAYYCFCSEEILEQMRQEQAAKKQISKYDRRCRSLSKEEIGKKLNANESYVIRMKIPDNRVIEINDIVRGKVLYNCEELDDQVLLKSDGYPTYHLAVVVDDHLMEISHVLRTEEWLPSTPKHILLYEFFGWRSPYWAHLPLLLNPDKTKMSKRKGDVSVDDYIKNGYLPEAMVNFLAFLGWNPGGEKEIYSMKELLKDFSLQKIHKAGAIFNIEKLDWLNGHYIKQLSLDKLKEYAVPFLIKYNLIEKDNYDSEYIKKILALEQPRLKKFDEIGDRVAYFFQIPKYNSNLLTWRDMPLEDVITSLKTSRGFLVGVNEGDFTRKSLEDNLLKEATKAGSKDRGRLLWPLRVALTGLQTSPSPFEILEILGKNESIKRIDLALENLV
ncbi:MAG: glutamate--tRNA ligase [Candidatus Azambacteria bacterium]|nr:glutamate--tRNA ligase [Candidatus Azambacteria bacterium]